MQGDTVVIREFGGRPLIRRVWAANDDVVFVCSEERYKHLLAGEDDRYPVGFPREYVYQYDESIVVTLQSLWEVDPTVWSSLSIWEASNGNGNGKEKG